MQAVQARSLREMLQRHIARLFSIEAEYRWAMQAAELQWTQALVRELRSGDFDGLEVWRRFHSERSS